MKLILGLITLLAANSAFAIPGPHVTAKAELKAIVEHIPHGRNAIFYSYLDSIINDGADENGHSVYLVKSKGETCVRVTVESKMAEPVGDARSSNEIVAKVTSISLPFNCN